MKAKEELFKNDFTALTHSFQDACSDKEFRKYLDELKIKDDILMKYTSSLEDSFLEYNNCKNCKGLLSCKNLIPGYRYTPIEKNDVITFTYDACDKEIKELTDNKYKNIWYAKKYKRCIF